MVRLKELESYKKRQVLYISIPYGAIKRIRYHLGVGVKFPFQFLMVRLKEKMNDFINNLLGSFQFLMVRLKEVMKNLERILERNFNSLWCD